MLKAVVIDFDDTIAQTSIYRKGLLKCALKQFNNTPDNVEITLNWGIPFNQMIEEFVDKNSLESFILYYKSILNKNPTKPCPGAKRFLQTMQKKQIVVVVLSSSISALINHDLDALGFLNMIHNVFDCSLKNCKPSPVAMQATLNWLKSNYCIKPSECVYVGDSLFDLMCNNNQVEFFAVLSGSCTRQDFFLKNVDKKNIVKNLNILCSILTKR